MEEESKTDEETHARNRRGSIRSGKVSSASTVGGTTQKKVKKQNGGAAAVEEAKPYRRIRTNHHQQRKYLSNAISSGKYTLLSFVPKFIFEQFRRYSNIFFLAISCFQQIPNVSPTGRFTTLIPLVFIMTVSAAKEIIEDLKRHRADRATNNREVLVFKKGSTPVITMWSDVQVGDFCKIRRDEAFPADLVLYSSSEDTGICFVETSNLDGETNLKIRQSLPVTSNITAEDVLSIKGYIECEEPNRFLYEFLGKLSVDGGKSEHALSPDQILLRGSRLQNTAWAIGQVIYTGHETKLMKNASKAPLKRSTVEKITNKQIFLLFLLLMAIAVTYTILSLWWIHIQGKQMWYLPRYKGGSNGVNSDYHTDLSYSFAYTMFTFVILFNTLVPISLTVSLEIVRFIQAKFIEKDLDMYFEQYDIPATAKTSNLNEELGLITYIFSDKTGTLTQNVMEFKGCSVGGQIYRPENIGDGDTSVLIHQINRQHKTADDIRGFLTILSVCHTVIPDRSTGDLVYHASSPDERALVIGAQKHGYMFDHRTPSTVRIRVGLDEIKEEEYEILHTLEFNSDRKRMSVVVRRPDGRLMLFCKGADAIIFDRLSRDPSVNSTEVMELTQKHLDEFANIGLRTLCLAEKNLDTETYNQWSKEYHAASVSIIDHNEKIAEAEAKIENNLRLVGATAVEDKLQDEVPETIACLLKAGISIWVLTGDKQETAINIGRSCNLLTEDMKLFILNAESSNATYKAVMKCLEELHSTYGEHIPRDVPAAVVVDGKTLNFATNRLVKPEFMSLCTHCRVVICCRSTPFQKAEIVGEVTKKTGKVTLAIGDGANDVAMIQKAHVGVGIAGLEGLQAASSSDYAIGQFRYLRKLLLVHGAWNFNRIGKVILYCFYKNVLLYVIQLWFAVHNGFSGQILFDKWTISLYNLMFTALQPLAIGLFEKNVRAEMRLTFPHMYFENQASFSMRVFLWWIAVGCLQSFAIYTFSMHTVGAGIVWGNGREGGLFVVGNYVYTYVIFVASLKAGFELKSWTAFSHIAIWGSICLWIVFLPIYGAFSAAVAPRIGTDIIGIAEMVFTSVSFWAGLPVVIVICFLPELVFQVLKNHFASESEEERRREEDVYLQEQDSNEKILLAKQSTIAEIRQRLDVATSSNFSRLSRVSLSVEAVSPKN